MAVFIPPLLPCAAISPPTLGLVQQLPAASDIHRRFQRKPLLQAGRRRTIDGEALFLVSPAGVRRTAIVNQVGTTRSRTSCRRANTLAHGPVAAAEPVWPVAGAESASATIDDPRSPGDMTFRSSG